MSMCVVIQPDMQWTFLKILDASNIFCRYNVFFMAHFVYGVENILYKNLPLPVDRDEVARGIIINQGWSALAKLNLQFVWWQPVYSVSAFVIPVGFS